MMLKIKNKRIRVGHQCTWKSSSISSSISSSKSAFGNLYRDSYEQKEESIISFMGINKEAFELYKFSYEKCL
jgi:hypothetical protein